MSPADIDPYVSLGRSDSSDYRGVLLRITSCGSYFPSILRTVSLLAWDSLNTSIFKFHVSDYRFRSNANVDYPLLIA